ncbi:MAG: hypothetical protein VYD19_08940 [Myxococcota bacterium]|nr:hypothetical protein [Myxococcota bacterium]
MEREFIYIGLTSLLFLTQLLGALFLASGVRWLVSGAQTEGQGEAPLRALRGAIGRQLAPLLWGSLPLLLMIGLCFWEQNPLTRWLQGIAPLSTLLWCLWSHWSARRLEAGALFEALVPLSPAEWGGDPRVRVEARQWSASARSLSPRSLVQTALEALDAAERRRGGEERSARSSKIEIDTALQVLRDALRETRVACLQFPFGRELTLADWIAEGQRVHESWQRGSKRINIGRALLNPFTLVDTKGLWSWSSGQPAQLFERELSAWLHHGVYLLITRRVEEELSRAEGEGADEKGASQPSAPRVVTDQRLQREEAPLLWSILWRKLKVPFWLYWLLGGAALTSAHGLTGLVLTLCAGGVLWVTLRHVTGLGAWRALFSKLAQRQRAPRADLLRETSIALIRAEEERAAEAETGPLLTLLELTQRSSVGIASLYRREEHKEPPEALLNATIVDALWTLELICDDLYQWRQRGGLFAKLLKLFEQLGQRDGTLEGKLLEAARLWASAEELQAGEEGAEEVEAASKNALYQGAMDADEWITVRLESMNRLLQAPSRLLLEQAISAVQSWLMEEIEGRLIPLYAGEVKVEDTPTA